MSTVQQFNIGRDCSLVCIAGDKGRVDFTEITGFMSKAEVTKARIKPLNKPAKEVHIPEGWTGSFEIERASSAADDLQASIEDGFWSGQGLPYGTIFQYIREVDGKLSTFQYEEVAMHLSDAGDWKSDSVVKQKVEFFASRRRKIT